MRLISRRLNSSAEGNALRKALPCAGVLRNAVHCLRKTATRSLSVIAVLALSGCTHVTQDVYATFKHHFSSADDAELSSEEIADLPYTALYVRDGDQPKAVMILGFVDREGEAPRYSFISRSRQTLVQEHGRIVRTEGLAVQLQNVSNRSNDPLRCIVSNPNCPTQWQRQVDVRESRPAVRSSSGSYSESVRSTFSVQGQGTIELPTGRVTATHVIEQGRFEQSGKRFTNEFWLEEDGHVVKSIQQITPNHPPIELTQVKWVGR